MHLDEEQVQRLLHGELTPAVAASVRDHLAACTECRSRVADAEGEEVMVFGELSRLDHPAPPVQVAEVMRGRRSIAWQRWAAGILLAIGLAGAAYAAPGSPVRWVVDRVAAWFSGSAPGSLPPTPGQPTDSVTRGIAVAPGDRFAIEFLWEQRGNTVTVTLIDGTDVAVRAIGGAGTFTSDVDRLSIDNRHTTARFEIDVPRAAPRVEITVAGRRLFNKVGSRIVSAGRREAEDRYVIPFAAAP